MNIYIDADACPVKDEVFKVAGRHGLMTHVVANFGLRVPQSPLIQMTIVPEGPDIADDWIAERAKESDIVITGDIPLADRCLKNGAVVLNHSGKPFDDDSIGMALAVRDINAHRRESTDYQGKGPSFSKQDRSNFLQALEVAVQKQKRR